MASNFVIHSFKLLVINYFYFRIFHCFRLISQVHQQNNSNAIKFLLILFFLNFQLYFCKSELFICLLRIKSSRNKKCLQKNSKHFLFFFVIVSRFEMIIRFFMCSCVHWAKMCDKGTVYMCDCNSNRFHEQHNHTLFKLKFIEVLLFNEI